MYDQQAFENLKVFFETKQACREAVAPLSKKVEIGVVINQHNMCTFFKDKNGAPKFEKRSANNPDVIFYLSPESVESIINGPSDNICEMGIHVTKNYLAGSIKIKITGSLFNLITGGYLGILKTGGYEYMQFLATHGLTNLSKIKEFLQNRRV